jgi:hypothetical protein
MPFQFLESKGEIELNVHSGIGVVRQVVVVFEAQFFSWRTQRQVPFHAGFFPVFVPFHFLAGAQEELHFHLLKLAHAEDELPRYDLVAESLTDLCDAEGYFLAGGFVYIEEVDEDTLRRFRAEVELAVFAGDVAQLCGKHEVELAHFRPVARAGFGVGNFQIVNDGLQFGHISGGGGFGEAVEDSVVLLLVFQHARIGLAVHGLVEAVAEALQGLFHLLVHFLLDLFQMAFDELVGAVAFFAVFVVNEWIVERIHVA